MKLQYSTGWLGHSMAVVHTGLYSRKAARLLDYFIGTLYAPYFLKRVISTNIHGVCYLPQNMEDDDNFVFHDHLKGIRLMKPHFVTICPTGEICLTVKFLFKNKFFNSDNLHKPGLIKHLTAMFDMFCLSHTEEQNAEIERLLKVLTSRVSKRKYADLYGIPLNPLAFEVAEDTLKTLKDIQKIKDRDLRAARIYSDATAANYYHKYADKAYAKHKHWWKLMLLLD
jgi:hypothetical protein